MHHDENDPRHPHYRDPRQRREQPPEDFARDRYFNDFKSRWGEPAPPLNLHREEWQPREAGRFEQEGRFHQHREEWLPNERRHQHPHQEHPQHEHHPRDRDTSWRQRDVNFDRDNQRAEDRWQQHDDLPHPDDRRRHRQGLPEQDRFWDERNRDDRSRR